MSARHASERPGTGGRAGARAGPAASTGRAPRPRGCLFGLLLALLGLGLGGRALFGRIGGASSMSALTSEAPLSPAARALLLEVYRDLDPARILDYHTHLVGIGAGSDCWVNPRLRSWSSPLDHLRFLLYRDAAGISVDASADADFVSVLARLARAQPQPGRLLLLAFDWRYRVEAGGAGTDGLATIDRAHSEFHVPNDYLFGVVAREPDLFLPCVSIHPYRADALPALEAAVARGAKFCKWLPNAMGIDPADARCDPFYEACARLGVTLLSHGGEEQAVEARADQELGNPLRLRRALDRGVRVICAHCATLGEGLDLDQPGARGRGFDFFLRLMGEARYEGLLFGELSAVLQQNRFPIALETLLARRELHERLVYGSDWPLPAVNIVISTRALAAAGFLKREEVEPLNELYDANPLLFSLALTRRVQHPESGRRFPASVFQTRPEFGLD